MGSVIFLAPAIPGDVCTFAVQHERKITDQLKGLKGMLDYKDRK